MIKAEAIHNNNTLRNTLNNGRGIELTKNIGLYSERE